MKKYIFGGIVLVAGLLLGLNIIGRHVAPTPAPSNLGAVTDIDGYNFTAGINFGSVKENWGSGQIYPKTNEAYWKNTTGRTQYIDLLDVSTDGTASSTYTIYAVATSSPLTTLYDFTAPVSSTGQMLINGFKFATSSTATTTSNYDFAGAGKVVRVPDGQYVDIYLTAPIACPSGGGNCESATSTNRGFTNVFWRMRMHD